MEGSFILPVIHTFDTVAERLLLSERKLAAPVQRDRKIMDIIATLRGVPSDLRHCTLLVEEM